MQNLDNKDKILKIFSRVHCFNKDQLPRYVDGRLTHVEKHLLEQHLVNCELCSDAVEILQKPKFKTQYQSMGQRVQQYIRNSTDIAPQLHETERYQKKIEITESFLTYFWGAVAGVFVLGLCYLVQQQVKKENKQHSFANVGKVSSPVGQPEQTAALVPTHPDSANTANAAMLPNKQEGAMRKETDKPTITEETADADKSLYKTAMDYYHDGNLDEAMSRLTKLTADSSSRYRELAHYQLAMCYKFKRQKGKARHMFKELVEMNGRMKKRAQLALNKL
ncbi:zf-HC2 domain-containing protein [Chitinophaga pinensis]|uniref:Zf-HC2 domain-containing protein n=1 Tax=Chitinophaga pinensis TaxID=79329 RepID=A0A5C6LKW5_9BACT|nr:zf-HC2 domain-containing protein [Chitinophaga pinensis]TWV89429.1 zf-HC2 domain-containing protein [Chitinophaga pinensis]